MIVNLDEMKGYLRVDFDDDDALIENFVTTGQNLCADIARLSVDELGAIPSSKIAVMYAVAYLYEHREDADHHQLTISLRSLLLNVKITVQKNETVVDAIGNHKNTWTDYHTCFATVSGEGGSEKSVAGLIVDDSDISFTVRYCKAFADLDVTKHRVIFEGSLYNIVSIDHMNYKKKCLKLKCEKVRR